MHVCIDHYKVEADIWHHAMQDNKTELEKMPLEKVEEWLRNADKEMGIA